MKKKAQGMSRGLEGMKAKLEKTKKMPLWNRLVDEIAGFTKLKQGLEQSQAALLGAEQNYYDLMASKSPSGVELSKLKSKISQTKEEFKKRLSQLERRVTEFRDGLGLLLEPLGKDRAEALVQEINERIGEQFNHYEADRATLAELFAERADKEKSKLEDRKMSVFVWARNPDIDLYQGNYSPCCICIDSAHMGAESTIADYATDLGVQVISVWDETKQEPVVAAWTWLGIDEDGKTALVVDNIEANTHYSSNFPQALSKELFDYLKNYAKAIKAHRIVLGKANNDLPTAQELYKLEEAGAEYTKLGGVNNRLDGYFLEAEETSVKLVWERAAEKQEIKKKEKKERKIELKDFRPSALLPQDFDWVTDLESQVYEEELARGAEMIDELKNKEGLKYSVALWGKRGKDKNESPFGYTVAYEDETDEGESCVYLDDIAVTPELRGKGLGWQLLKETIFRIKEEAARRGKPVYFDMHLRPDSRALIERHEQDIKNLGMEVVESALVPDYYDAGEDALYQVFEVRK
ncbi:GNAT family N-acetyltransferase [Patescibacteria group bacterium]|nr:GNAT family N-acetyltransferase [Patescibacteria group bacterium]